MTGVVTYRGKPVAGAGVAFHNDRAPRLASGETDESGRYQLSTFEPGDGAVIGTHVVTVYKAKKPIAPVAADPKLGHDAYMAALEKAAQQAIASDQAGSLLPAKYADPKTSDLQKEVRAGENEVNIELVD